jgi:hypothetical protein
VQLTQGIENTLALPMDKMLYIYLLCPHSEHQKKYGSNLNSLNTFTKEMGSPGSNKVKLPKVGSDAIVPGPINPQWDHKLVKEGSQAG